MKNIKIKSLREKQKKNLKNINEFFIKKTEESNKSSVGKIYKPTKLKKIALFIFFFIFVFFVGGIGGVFMDRSVIPYLIVNYPQLKKYNFFKEVSKQTTIIETTKEIKITQEKAVVESVKKAKPYITQIIETDSNGNEKYKGSGIVLTSDGFLLVPSESLFKDDTIYKKTEEVEKNIKMEDKNNDKISNTKIKINNGETYIWEFIAKDEKTNFSIIKIKKENLQPADFEDLEKPEIGEKLVILNNIVKEAIISEFIDNYISDEKETFLKNKKNLLKQKRIRISIVLEDSFYGAPVVNLKGKVIGISQGKDIVIPTNEIKDFIDKTLNNWKSSNIFNQL